MEQWTKVVIIFSVVFQLMVLIVRLKWINASFGKKRKTEYFNSFISDVSIQLQDSHENYLQMLAKI